jgi:hypothetical protein
MIYARANAKLDPSMLPAWESHRFTRGRQEMEALIRVYLFPLATVTGRRSQSGSQVFKQ